MDLSIESRCIHLEHDHGENRFGAISFPIYQTATFSQPVMIIRACKIRQGNI